MRAVRFGVLLVVLVALTSPVSAQDRWVSDFTNLVVTPTVTDHGPPVLLDLGVEAITSGFWATSPGDYSVFISGNVWNSTTSLWDSTTVDRTPGTNRFEATFSFTLPADGIYNYWAFAYYYGPIFGTYYSTSTGGAFNTVSRAGIPTLSHLGLAFLGMLTAGVGVFLLRRR